MRRIRKRTLGIVVGLSLGWLAAGYFGDWMPGVYSPSASAQTQTGHEAAGEHGRETAGHEAAEPAGEHHDDEGLAAARELKPEPRDIPWLKPVLWTAFGLFAAAIVLGIPALKLRGPLPPDPADTHDDHDDHGHDDHAHDHGHEHKH